MSIYLYKRIKIPATDSIPEECMVELLAKDDKIEKYDGSLVDTFTINFLIDHSVIKSIIVIDSKYRLELITDNSRPVLLGYVEFKRYDKPNIKYFLVEKDSVTDGYIFTTDPVEFINSVNSVNLATGFMSEGSGLNYKYYNTYIISDLEYIPRYVQPTIGEGLNYE